MRILFITNNFPPEVNAAASRVYERAIYWVKWGIKVTIITRAPNFPEGKIYKGYKNYWFNKETIDGITVIRTKAYCAANKGIFKRLLDFNSFMITSFIVGIFQIKHDVVIATSPQFFSALSGWLISFCKRTPFIFELGDLWPESVKAVGVMRENILLNFFEQVELFLYRRSVRIIALTNAFKQNLSDRNIDPDKIDVVKNGVDSKIFFPRVKDQELLKKYSLENKFIIGYIGTFGAAHGLECVIDVANTLKFHDKLHFVFVGAGAEMEILIAKTKRLKLSNITFFTKQPKNEIARFWSICDISLVHLKNSPTFKGVIPSKIFEAMGMGLPILLAGPEGEASGIINNEKVGVHIISEDIQLLSKTIMNLMDNQDHLNNFKKNSIISAKKYTREHQAKLVIESVERALLQK